MATKVELGIALTFLPVLRQRYADYVEECKSYYRQGYRPHYCEHGTNLWTDYDNICGPCEDGLTLRNGAYLYRVALDWAHDTVDEARIRNLALDFEKVLDSGDVDAVRAFLAESKPDMGAVWDETARIRRERS